MRGTGSTGGVAVEWGAMTDVGRSRSVNEDAVLAEPSVFVVADGMGGHQAGDVASALVVDRFSQFAGDQLSTMDDVVDAIRSVNQAIHVQGRTSDDRNGMGTTAVGLMLVENGDQASLLLFNVGDSRAYCFVDGELEQVSVDHSYVQELVDSGQLTVAAAREHPQRNVVTRALGVDETVEADFWLRSPTVGERYLLCSDGLNSEVDDDQIRKVLAAPVGAEGAAIELVEQALAAGGRDNISVLVLDVVDVSDDTGSSDTAPRGLIAAIVSGSSDDGSETPTAEHGANQLLDVGEVPGARGPADLDAPVEPASAEPAALIDVVPDVVCPKSAAGALDG